MVAEETKRNYPAKWQLAQRLAMTSAKSAEQLFVELGGGSVESYSPPVSAVTVRSFTIHSLSINLPS